MLEGFTMNVEEEGNENFIYPTGVTNYFVEFVTDDELASASIRSFNRNWPCSIIHLHKIKFHKINGYKMYM